MDLASLIDEFNRSGYGMEVARDPRIQFGTANRVYKGAELLPSITSDSNMIQEDLVRYDVVIADDGSPRSGPQIKATSGSSELVVRLGHIDIAAQMTGADMKILGKLVNGNDTAPAMEFLSRWLVRAVRLGLEEKAEKQRWEAIGTGLVNVNYRDGTSKTVSVNVPANHKVTVPSGSIAAPQGWYSPTYDPFREDIFEAKQILTSLGYIVTRCITSTRIRDGVLATNEQVLKRSGGVLVTAGGQLQSTLGAASAAAINAQMAANELPPVETYDLHYRTQTGAFRFLPDTKFVMVATTGRNQEVDLGDAGIKTIENTLGYYGVGVSEGQSAPGAVITTLYSEKKPVGIYSEGYQEGFPVLMDGDAIFVFDVPYPTA